MYTVEQYQATKERIAANLSQHDPYQQPKFALDMWEIERTYGNGDGGLKDRTPHPVATKYNRGLLWNPANRHKQPAFEELMCSRKSVRLHLDAMMADALANVTDKGLEVTPAICAQEISAEMVSKLLISKLRRLEGHGELVAHVRLSILEGVEELALAKTDYQRLIAAMKLWGLCFFATREIDPCM